MALPAYRQGRILWARLRAQSGKKELHPAVIITADKDIVQPEQFDPRQDITKVNAVAVVGVSTAYLKYPPYIKLPFAKAKGGHPVTKLTADCAVCLGWYDWVILEEDVEGKGGDVPPAEMTRIMNEIANDLVRKLTSRAVRINRESAELHEMLGHLIEPP